jgi:hypothetical protein
LRHLFVSHIFSYSDPAFASCIPHSPLSIIHYPFSIPHFSVHTSRFASWIFYSYLTFCVMSPQIAARVCIYPLHFPFIGLRF